MSKNDFLKIKNKHPSAADKIKDDPTSGQWML